VEVRVQRQHRPLAIHAVSEVLPCTAHQLRTLGGGLRESGSRGTRQVDGRVVGTESVAMRTDANGSFILVRREGSLPPTVLGFLGDVEELLRRTTRTRPFLPKPTLHWSYPHPHRPRTPHLRLHWVELPEAIPNPVVPVDSSDVVHYDAIIDPVDGLLVDARTLKGNKILLRFIDLPVGHLHCRQARVDVGPNVTLNCKLRTEGRRVEGSDVDNDIVGTAGRAREGRPRGVLEAGSDCVERQVLRTWGGGWARENSDTVGLGCIYAAIQLNNTKGGRALFVYAVGIGRADR
jgi:hypothetical protein